MGERLIIFGGGGFVGGNLARAARRQGWSVLVADREAGIGPGGVEWKTVDITDPSSVDALVTGWKPDAAVNLAAVADIDRAEREKDLTWKINVEGAANTAESCAKAGIRYVFFSSDAVFDGEGDAYSEEAPVNPVNFYGRTKAEAEKLVMVACPEAVIVRISLVMGFPVETGNSFFAGLQRKLAEGNEIMCPPAEIRTPVDVLTLSECVLELIGGHCSGVFHIGSTDSISRFELTQKVAAALGYDKDRIRVQTQQEMIAVRALRHRNGILCVKKAQSLLKTRLLSSQEGLERALRREWIF